MFKNNKLHYSYVSCQIMTKNTALIGRQPAKPNWYSINNLIVQILPKALRGRSKVYFQTSVKVARSLPNLAADKHLCSITNPPGGRDAGDITKLCFSPSIRCHSMPILLPIKAMIKTDKVLGKWTQTPRPLTLVKYSTAQWGTLKNGDGREYELCEYKGISEIAEYTVCEWNKSD